MNDWELEVKKRRLDAILMTSLVIVCAAIIAVALTGCMSILSDEDWNRFAEKLEAAGVSPEKAQEQTAILKEIEKKQAKANVELGKAIKDTGIEIIGEITQMPEDVREKTKDWTDELMKWLVLGGGGAALLGGGAASLRNSEKGKVFGPIRSPKEKAPEAPAVNPLAGIEELQRKYLELIEAQKKTVNGG